MKIHLKRRNFEVKKLSHSPAQNQFLITQVFLYDMIHIKKLKILIKDTLNSEPKMGCYLPELSYLEFLTRSTVSLKILPCPNQVPSPDRHPRLRRESDSEGFRGPDWQVQPAETSGGSEVTTKRDQT